MLYTVEQLILYMQMQIALAGSQKAFAKQCGISEQYLTDILKLRREPGEKILKALGWNRVVMYTMVDKGSER